MAQKKRGLGRGLDALLGNSPGRNGVSPERPVNSPEGTKRPEQVSDSVSPGDSLESGDAAAHGETGFRELPVEFIRPGKYQPRQHFEESALDELAASIRSQGLLQPLVVRPVGTNQFEIIAGERRWRASQRAGLANVPVFIREVDDEATIAMALIENLQREDLNPLESALGMKRLIDEFEMTHEQVAGVVGMNRVTVSNTLRLLHLAAGVQEMLAAGDLEMGHARALLSLPLEQQAEIARTVVNDGLSVRQTEALTRKLTAPRVPADSKKKDADTARLEEQLSQRLGQPVAISHSRRGRGKVVVSYNSLDELEGILKHFGDLDL